MKDRTTVNYFRKIREIIPARKFKIIEDNLFRLNNELLESFWNIVSAGYPVEFAILNCINLFEYVRDNDVNYKEALRIVYSIYPGLKAGINVKTPRWYELN